MPNDQVLQVGIVTEKLHWQRFSPNLKSSFSGHCYKSLKALDSEISQRLRGLPTSALCGAFQKWGKSTGTCFIHGPPLLIIVRVAHVWNKCLWARDWLKSCISNSEENFEGMQCLFHYFCWGVIHITYQTAIIPPFQRDHHFQKQKVSISVVEMKWYRRRSYNRRKTM